jgi:hypothetical protein
MGRDNGLHSVSQGPRVAGRRTRVLASPSGRRARTSTRTRVGCPRGGGARGADGHAPRPPPAANLVWRYALDTLVVKVAGLDVHRKSIPCAVRSRQESGKVGTPVRSFGTVTRALPAVADSLPACGVTPGARLSSVRTGRTPPQ